MYRLHFDNNRYVTLKAHATLGSAMKTAKREITADEQTAWQVGIVEYDSQNRAVHVTPVKVYYNYTNLALHTKREGPAPASATRQALQALKQGAHA